jgi:hypothetical protein
MTGDMAAGRPPKVRPFLGVLFECCNVYRRIYLHHTGKMYLGACPRCGKTVRFDVDDRKGQRARFWRAK